MSEDVPRIGRYEVITRLAVGGMAELFLAREVGIAGLERVVVLKRILPHLADNPRFVEMFLREARIVARLTHPNVVQIFDLGSQDGSYFIAMEYIDGSTVRELQVLCERHGRKVPINVAVGIVLQALRGLHAAHELKDLDGKLLKLVHRDVSPHNLMCTSDGSVKLLDFGVAKATEDGLENTNSGHLKGKFAYMSPEHLRRKPLDRRADVFSMGAVMWELLTGARLFKRESEVEMMEAVLNGDVPSLTNWDPNIPESIERVVMRALEGDRQDRYPSADAMRQDLLTAASATGLDVGADPVGQFVEDTAGAHLDLRRETLQSAMERSLSVGERDPLVHLTGSGSHSRDSDFDAALAVKMTRDLLHEASSSRSLSDNQPAAITGETAISGGLTGPAPQPSPKQKGAPWVVVGGLMVVACVMLAMVFSVVDAPIGEDEPDAGVEPILLGEPLAIAWAPTVTPELLREEIEPLRKYLERSLGRPISLAIAGSYEDSSGQLLRGEVEFAVLPPLMYVRTRAQDDRVQPVAIKLFDGATHSDGLILSRGDGDITEISKLYGKKFCFTDPNSTTGNFLPRAFIKRSGFDPEKFIGDVHWSGNHLQAMRDLLANKCDAAAVYSGAFLSADDASPRIPVGQLRQVAITGNVPQDPIVAGPRVSDADLDAMRTALLAFDPQKEVGQRRLGDTQRITSFKTSSNDDFEDLRKIVDEFADVPTE